MPEIINCEVTFKCPKDWEALAATRDDGRRYCTECDRDVFWCRIEAEMSEAASKGKCVAFSSGPVISLGLPSSRRKSFLE